MSMCCDSVLLIYWLFKGWFCVPVAIMISCVYIEFWEKLVKSALLLRGFLFLQVINARGKSVSLGQPVTTDRSEINFLHLAREPCITAFCIAWRESNCTTVTLWSLLLFSLSFVLGWSVPNTSEMSELAVCKTFELFYICWFGVTFK